VFLAMETAGEWVGGTALGGARRLPKAAMLSSLRLPVMVSCGIFQ